jgi:PAT family beta-lactamase induction signal transducer AmpG
VGIRSTFYRLATIAGQGLLVIMAGYLELHTSSIPMAWSITFLVLAAFFILIALYHRFLLPRPATVEAGFTPALVGQTFTSFFRKKHIIPALLFMLLYRFPEAQLVKLIQPFLLDPADKGGLGLTTAEVGVVYGTVGIAGLTVGGIVGGIAVAHGGLRRWLWPMAWSISLTCATFLYLSVVRPDSLWTISACVAIEQFGYGFGFTAYMLYLMHFSQGERQTAHYALCTAFMAAGMMLPGMAAGWLQEELGYTGFFGWVMFCCAVTIGVSAYIYKVLKDE